MVVEFGVEKLCHVTNAVDFGISNILHAARDILGRLFIFRLCGSQLFLDAEIVTFCLLDFGDACIIGQTAILELFASSLRWTKLLELLAHKL
jgi:hypothetical protein